MSPTHHVRNGNNQHFPSPTSPPSPTKSSLTTPPFVPHHTMTSQELPIRLASLDPFTTPSLPFMSTMNLIDLTKLTNNLIYHDATFPNILTKVPLDMTMFKGKIGEESHNHVMSFHLWLSSNSIIEDSIGLHLFQCTLTRIAFETLY